MNVDSSYQPIPRSDAALAVLLTLEHPTLPACEEALRAAGFDVPEAEVSLLQAEAIAWTMGDSSEGDTFVALEVREE